MVKPCRLSSPMVRPICCTITGARPSFGSSRMTSRAPGRRMRPMATICGPPLPGPSAKRALPHPRILGYRVVVPPGEDLATLEHGDAVGQGRALRQVVLDHQDGAIGGDALDQRADALDVGVRHAGRRLIE